MLSVATKQLIDRALQEDIGDGDVTSLYFVPDTAHCTAYINTRENGVISGLAIAKEVCYLVDDSLTVKLLKKDGDTIQAGDRVMSIEGKAQSILTAERTALNFLQRLSGIASKTQNYVAAVAGTNATVLDTRKTTPGWRELEKYAVTCGGGQNHRMGLYDRAMVKDNHLMAQDGLETLRRGIQALKEEKSWVEIELEADTLEQVEAFLTLPHVDFILLDNMSLDEMSQAISLRDASPNKPKLEASGGVTLDTIRSIAETGVDFISVGALTHSAVAIDLGMDFEEA